jgi:phosphatidylglycerol---prolipoprotein diacylglyceryl transferase
VIPVLLFPNLDPVAVQIGPLAIRWYALAYIVGIVLSWRLMRRLAVQVPEVATPAQVDDFVSWATLGVVLGGRLGYCLFLAYPVVTHSRYIWGAAILPSKARRRLVR